MTVADRQLGIEKIEEAIYWLEEVERVLAEVPSARTVFAANAETLKRAYARRDALGEEMQREKQRAIETLKRYGMEPVATLLETPAGTTNGAPTPPARVQPVVLPAIPKRFHFTSHDEQGRGLISANRLPRLVQDGRVLMHSPTEAEVNGVRYTLETVAPEDRGCHWKYRFVPVS